MAKKDKSSNQTMLDIISGISQALSNKYDGAKDEDGKDIKIGLKRDVENPITDFRQMDGFGARVQGEFLIVTYHSQILMTDVHNKKFEKDIDGIFADIVKFIKKEYKKSTKQTLGLKEKGETQIKIETMSRVRSWVVAKKFYSISKAEVEEEGDSKDLDKAIENWLSQSSTKKPKNVSIKKGANDKEDK